MKTESNGALRLWVHGWKLVDDFSSRDASSGTHFQHVIIIIYALEF
jgi:hypothetical protein